MGVRIMDINKMIRTTEKPESFLKKQKYRYLLRKDIKKEISELRNISIPELNNDMHRIMQLNGFKRMSTEDEICIKYGLPLDGISKVYEYLSTSYYFAHLYDISIIQEFYFTDLPLFTTEMKERFLQIYILHSAMFPIFERAAKDKHYDIISKRISNTKEDMQKLTAYKKLIEFYD